MIIDDFLLIFETDCCAFKEAFSNEGILPEYNIFKEIYNLYFDLKYNEGMPQKDNISGNVQKTGFDLRYIREESINYWLGVVHRELDRLKDMPEILYCGHAKNDHVLSLTIFIFEISAYRAYKKLKESES